MPLQQLLLETLEDLIENDFNTLKWYLTTKVLDSCRPIARSHLENAKRTETVTKVISSYGEDRAAEVCVQILRKMNQNGSALELEKAYAGEKETRLSSASGPAPAALGAPAGQMTAQTGGVIVAPTVTGGGTFNITISK